MRAAGSDNTVSLTPPIDMSLDACVEYINTEEVVEVTPTVVRMGKKPGWKANRKAEKNNK